MKCVCVHRQVKRCVLPARRASAAHAGRPPTAAPAASAAQKEAQSVHLLYTQTIDMTSLL